jgi:hypothetical protein
LTPIKPVSGSKIQLSKRLRKDEAEGALTWVESLMKKRS